MAAPGSGPAPPSGAGLSMLDGFKVLELATHIAAPAAAGILSDWGADVIKIESVAGDPMRWLRAHAPGGCSPVFETNNRGKRSLSLDIGNAEGRAIVRRLARDVDVFITNLRPGSLERAGLDWARLHAENPGLVYCSVTGYGLQGEEADTPAFDNAAFWSRSGFAHLTAPEGSDPFSLRQGSGDHTCALAASLGTMAALLARARTGQGRLVEASLLRTGVFVLGADFSNQIRLGGVAATQTRARAVNPLNNFFRTGDGRWLFFMPRSAAIGDWDRLCRAAGAPELGHDPRFATPEDRTANGPALVGLLDEAFAKLAFAEAARRLTAEDVVWAPVQGPAEVLADPQARAAGCFIDAADGDFQMPGPPTRFDGQDITPRGPPPALGQHTDEILAGLGYATAEIEEMRRNGRVR